MRALFFFISLVIFQTPVLSADGDHESGTSTSSDADTTEKTGTRLEQDGKLSEDVVKFLTFHFALPEEYIKGRYEKTIPPAIEKAIKGEEEPITEIIAELMGVVNGEQVAKIVEDAEKNVKDEREIKDPEKRDDRFIALMERLAWAGMLFSKDGLSKDEKAQKFNEQFKKAYEKTKEWNKEANEKLRQAADGVQTAKDWVKENISMKSILGFAEAQKKSGNSEAAERIVSALSGNQGKERFLDMWDGSEQQRLFLGQDKDSLKTAVNGFFDKKGGFGNAFAARKNFEKTPNTSWYMKDGAFTKGAPAGLEAPPTPTPAPSGTPGQNPGQNDAQIISEMTQIAARVCSQCHAGTTVEGNTLQTARFIKSGNAKTFADVAAAIDKVNDMHGPQFPKEVQDKIRAWASLQK